MAIIKYGLSGSNLCQNLTVSVKPYLIEGNTEGSLSDPVETTRWLPYGDEDIVQATRNSGYTCYF
jgi:hypothetical protein